MADLEPQPPAAPIAFNLLSVAGTAALWLSLAALVLMLRQVRPGTVWDAPDDFALAILPGLAGGAALAAGQLVLLRVWPAWRAFTREAVKGIRLGMLQVIVVAVLVSITEELFFRAALQPVLGIWLSSLLFALAHARLDRKSWAPGYRALGVVGLAMLFGTSLLFGLIYRELGLLSAVGAHYLYDVLVLEGYLRAFGSREVAVRPDGMDLP